MTREFDCTTQTAVIEIPLGGNIVKGVAIFAFHCRFGICILSCIGAVANVSFIDSTSSHAHASTFTLNGRFETLSLPATFLTCPIPRSPSHSSSSGSPTKLRITITLMGTNVQVIGGKVAGALIAAGPVIVLATSFKYISFLHLQPAREETNNTNLNIGAANAGSGDACLRLPSSEYLESPASVMENILAMQYYYYDARSGHRFRSKKEVDSFAEMGEVPRYKPKT